MKSSGWRRAAPIPAVLLILATAGCPGTDLLKNGNGTVSFELVAVGNLGAYDCVTLQLRSFAIVPQDGQCAPGGSDAGRPCYLDQDCEVSCEGSTAFGLLDPDGIPIVTSVLGPGQGTRGSLTGASCVAQNAWVEKREEPCTDVQAGIGDNCINNQISAPPIFQPEGVTLPAGLYRISDMQISDALLYNDNGALNGLQGCFGGASSAQQVADNYPDNSVWFTVQPGGSTRLRFEFNIDAFEAEFSPGVSAILGQDCQKLNQGQKIVDLIPIVEVGG